MLTQDAILGKMTGVNMYSCNQVCHVIEQQFIDVQYEYSDNFKKMLSNIRYIVDGDDSQQSNLQRL